MGQTFFASCALLCKFLRQVVKKPGRKNREVFIVVVSSLEVCPAPRKAVYSRKNNGELNLFIAPVLVSFFISYV